MLASSLSPCRSLTVPKHFNRQRSTAWLSNHTPHSPAAAADKPQVAHLSRIHSSYLGTIASSLIVACFFSSCASNDLSADTRAAQPAGTATSVLPFTEILANLDRSKVDVLIDELHVLRATAATRTRNEAAYVLGRILQKKGDHGSIKEALQLFSDASNIPCLSERCQWHRAECATALGEEKVVRRALQAIEGKTADIEQRAAADYGLAQSYLRAREKERAREAFAFVRTSFPRSNYALGATYYLAELAIDDPHQVGFALTAFRSYLTHSPGGHFARNILMRLSSLKSFTPTKADRALFAQVHFAQGEWQEALNDWAVSGQAQRFWWQRSVCLLRLGQTSEAKEALIAGLATHPLDSSVPEAARTLCQLVDRSEALNIWKKLLATSSKYGDFALWNLSLRSDPPQSLQYLTELTQKYPHSNFAPESHWWIFWDLYQHDKLRQALAKATAAQKSYPQSQTAVRFAFWSAVLHESLGEKDASRSIYRQLSDHWGSSYYVWRARARLESLTGGTDKGWLTAAGTWHPEESWSWPHQNELLTQGQLERSTSSTIATLIRLHQWEESIELLPPAASSTIRSFLYAMVNLPVDAINTASAGLTGSACATASWQLAYPLLYGQTIGMYSREEKIDPLLVQALVREESRYNPLAMSSSGAVGLMQLLPGTASGIAKKMEVDLSEPSALNKPENNLKLGIAYLARTRQRHESVGGSHAACLLAVASYNAGPAAVGSWVSHLSGRRPCDWDIFVENIPLTETRDYVRKVFASYWNYRAVYRMAEHTTS